MRSRAGSGLAVISAMLATLATETGAKARRVPAGCPRDMARVADFCIDRFEAPNRPNAMPLVMQSARDAAAWCSAHDKRMCTESEWIGACEGAEHNEYPYGSSHVDARCNDDKRWQKVDESTLAKWPAPEALAEVKSLYQASPSGARRRCVSAGGVSDLTGNVEEWVVRTREHVNPWPYVLIGCYWAGCYGGNKPTCHSTNNAHGPEFRYYETGFRCCKDAAGDGTSPERGAVNSDGTSPERGAVNSDRTSAQRGPVDPAQSAALRK